MEKVGSQVWKIRLSQDKLNLNDGKISYRYTRNGDGFKASEYLEPDKNETLRTTQFKRDSVQKDTVKRWHWFPEGKVSLTTNLAPSGSFLPRIGQENFLSVQTIEDLYLEAFRSFFDTTAVHMKRLVTAMPIFPRLCSGQRKVGCQRFAI